MSRTRDARGIELTTTSRRSAERYDDALHKLATYALDPLAITDEALAEDPDFVSGHCLRGALGILAWERSGEPLVRESVAAGKRLASRATERERAHFGALSAFLGGELHRAMDLYGAILFDHPRDQLALQVAHIGDFALGRTRMLRDRIAQVLPELTPDVPGYGPVQGMLAFGYEENYQFPEAEAAGYRALRVDARDAWAVHAVAHVHEMRGELDEGAAFLEARANDWAPDNMLAYHNYWHLALFHLEHGEARRVLSLFDEHVWPRASSIALEMVDAASLLWRLHLRGIPIGARATTVADAWSDPVQHGFYAFNDAHAVMALLLDGRRDDARRLVAAMERTAGEVGSNGMMTRTVGLPLARALVAFEEGRNEEVIDTLLPLRVDAHRFGGSHAQRDLLDQTLGEAAVRAGRWGLVRALSAERGLLRRENGWARYLAGRIPAARAA